MEGVILDYHVYIIVAGVVFIDIVSGLVKAFISDGFNSTKMRNGIAHKFTYIIALSLATMIEYGSIYLDFGYHITALQPATAIYIVVTEVGSILENLVVINPDLSNNNFMAIFSKEGFENAKRY